MSLRDYIERIGNTAAAHLFGVKPGTAKAWRYGYRLPSATAALRIIDRTGGKVSWDEIYSGSDANNARASDSAEATTEHS
jgi:DNA-binding transcriptional regulator YdaS (Cro superfamily)